MTHHFSWGDVRVREDHKGVKSSTVSQKSVQFSKMHMASQRRPSQGLHNSFTSVIEVNRCHVCHH